MSRQINSKYKTDVIINIQIGENVALPTLDLPFETNDESLQIIKLITDDSSAQGLLIDMFTGNIVLDRNWVDTIRS